MADPNLSNWHYYGNSPPPQGSNPFGLNLGQGGALGGVAQSLTPMIAEMFREQMGGYAFMFGSDMNVGSARMANQFLKQLGEARTKGAEADKDQIKQLFRGLAVAVGNKFVKGNDGKMDLEPDVLRSIDVLSSDASAMLPLLASAFPDTIDRLLPRGSMAVAAASFVNAGRFVVDPMTGQAASRDSMMASRILKPLLDQGPQATYGLGAGRLGQVYEELVSRGMIGSGRDLRGQVEAREATGGLFGIGMSGEEARDIQGGRVRERIQAYSRSISAINDIFAENGQANAPMKELLQSLQTLTQGGLGVYDPAALAGLARSLQSAAQVSGIGIQGLTQLAAYSGMSLDQYGAHRGLAAPIALRAAAYGMVYADNGFGDPSPEGMGRDEFIQAIAANQAAFAGSPVGNAIGAISALGRQAPAGSDFAALAAAVRRGETRVTLPGGRQIDLNSDLSQVADIARQSGLGGSYLQQLMATTLNKAEFVREPGMLLAGQKLQRTEFENVLLTQLGAQFAGINPGDLLANIYGASNEDSSDAVVARIVGEKMGLSAEMRGNLQASLAIAGSKTRGSSGATAARLFNPETAKDAEKSLKFIQDRGIPLDELSGLMRGGFMRNISNLFVQAGVKGSFPGLGMSAMQGLGMTTYEDLDQIVSGDLDPLGDSITAFMKFAYGRNRKAMGGVIGGFADATTPGTPGTPGVETESTLSQILKRGRQAKTGAGRWRDGAGADALDQGSGLFGESVDWAEKTARQKSDAAGKGPLQVNIAKLIVSQDGSAKLLQTEGTAAGKK